MRHNHTDCICRLFGKGSCKLIGLIIQPLHRFINPFPRICADIAAIIQYSGNRAYSQPGFLRHILQCCHTLLRSAAFKCRFFNPLPEFLFIIRNCSVSLTVTAKIHSKSPLAMDFSAPEALPYSYNVVSALLYHKEGKAQSSVPNADCCHKRLPQRKSQAASPKNHTFSSHSFL